MKHRSSRILFEHWHERRGSRALPERSAIDPGAIRSGLGDVFVLAFDPYEGHPFRLAGTRISALVGGSLKERSFVSLWQHAQQDELLRIVSLVADESVGVVAGVSAEAEKDFFLDLELLLLPLKHWGRTHSRLIGVLAPLSLPDWFGTRTLGPLTLGDYRYVGLRATDRLPAASALLRREVPRGAKVRRGLIVYDGGRT